MTTVRVVTAAQAAARDAACIAAGTPPLQLMQRAGTAAAEVIQRRFADRAQGPVAVLAGPGNNGGDGWVVAGALAAGGADVRVWETAPPRSDDVDHVKRASLPHVSLGEPRGSETLVIDALLGTGARGEPTGAVADGVARIAQLRSTGAVVVALDLPTGVDASGSIASRAVSADLTVTFGTMKRGHLLARERCGAIVVVDIGLGPYAELEDGAPRLVDDDWLLEVLPRVGPAAHKGTRKRVAIIGGSRGMAGASVLASQAAVRSGVGMVRLVVAEESLAAVQASAVEATALTWPLSDEAARHGVADYASAVLIGPGLGVTPESRRILEQILTIWTGPVVLDADALNLFAGDIPRLSGLLAGRPALITPHVVEMARLTGTSPESVERERFEVGRDVARALNAAVLLKGVPTVVSAPNGNAIVSATGTPALATAGSGDVLSGIAVTLLAQIGDAQVAGAAAAWVHGRAAEIANTGRSWRGITLHDVVNALGLVWNLGNHHVEPPELTALPVIPA